MSGPSRADSLHLETDRYLIATGRRKHSKHEYGQDREPNDFGLVQPEWTAPRFSEDCWSARWRCGRPSTAAQSDERHNQQWQFPTSPYNQRCHQVSDEIYIYIYMACYQRYCCQILCFMLKITIFHRLGDDWKKNLKLPPKDTRMRTSVCIT